jgi:hypothetical protein
MKAETIKAIFTNLLFVIGVIFLIFGFIQGTQTVVRLATFDKYPLQIYEETRCENEFPAMRPVIEPDQPPMSDQDQQERRQKCEASLDYQRRVKQTEDIVVSITTLVAGAVLVLSFKRFIFK